MLGALPAVSPAVGSAGDRVGTAAEAPAAPGRPAEQTCK